MKINVGTMNRAKVDAVKETIAEYEFLCGARVHSSEVLSEVSDHPKSLDETITGAMNRARNAFGNCDLSIGIESGLMKVPHTKTGYMDVAACVIYDGKEFHIGLSCAFEYPKEITRLIFEEGLNASEAANKTNLTANENIVSAEGIIGILTKGKVTRKDYTKQSLTMALIHLEHPHLWQR